MYDVNAFVIQMYLLSFMPFFGSVEFIDKDFVLDSNTHILSRTKITSTEQMSTYIQDENN